MSINYVDQSQGANQLHYAAIHRNPLAKLANGHAPHWIRA